ncbi:MAG: hypothetical protein Q8N35_16100 [Methylococcaceae bacterium]|nr:hypothetical protein [Methylococcaceae bacterium]MDZ4157316.1 hypothetical protein [Methylococcales bacterium]MDP2392605.1 hypothetical protein [Methylococcaceae bacterium]MDP3021105.1 hypothetical protein [Methylococcaceae bacterium]MDP3388492.1 hypothetical protein [Methylococcaceae bacterium]
MLVYFHGRGAWFLTASANNKFSHRLSRNFVFKDPETGETESTDEFYRLYDSIEQKLCQEFAGVFRLSPKDAIIYSEKKDLSHVEKLFPCNHQYSAFSIAVEDGCISKDNFENCYFLIQKSFDRNCFEHKQMSRPPYILDNKLVPENELDFQLGIENQESTIIDGSSDNREFNLNIKRRNPIERYSAALALLHNAIDKVEESTGKTPESDQLVIYVLGGTFEHDEIDKRDPESVIVKRRKLILKGGEILNSDGIKRRYHETIFKNKT